jgi:hypothetical protein
MSPKYICNAQYVDRVLQEKIVLLGTMIIFTQDPLFSSVRSHENYNNNDDFARNDNINKTFGAGMKRDFVPARSLR